VIVLNILSPKGGARPRKALSPAGKSRGAPPAFRARGSTSEYTGLCFAWLLADLLLRAGVLAPPEALKADAVCGDARWDGLAALHTAPSPRREAVRTQVLAVTWWWILCRQ
jgi:hypothetical protein